MDVDLFPAIERLRRERRAIILAHNYQPDEIQDLADFVGDSLALSQKAAKTDAEVIVFCGVHFMAETAAILAPEKKVLLPAPDAGCPLAEMAEPEAVLAAKKEHPAAAVVAYVNTSAAVKAVADYCCTSANAVRVVRTIPYEEIIFLPDRNLGHYVARQVPEKRIIIWPGFCVTHHRIRPEEVEAVRATHPDAPVLVHPECPPEVVDRADFVGSTSQIIKKVKEMEAETFIIGTEMGILHQLRKENPGKKFFLLSPGLLCPNMKRTTLERVHHALRELAPVVTVPEPIRTRARTALERMLAIT
ncbi:MAG: quinolinate synthase NadA [Firmicutes bacterium]|nr:quinolinate synthase NadA [Bacillota bacterium]